MLTTADPLSRWLDGVARPRITFLGVSWRSFRAAAMAGFLCSVAVAMAIAVHAGLSILVMAGVVVASVAAFLVLALAGKVLTGNERLVFYRHLIAVMAAAFLTARACGRPPGPYVAAAALGLGALLSVGRLGCLMVGCCHGRPSRVGVCYREEHAEEGFPAYYVGIRLFPLPALEAVANLVIVAVCLAEAFSSRALEAAMSDYLVAYAVLRFSLERWRGDAERPHGLALSEGQWTSLLVAAGIVVLEQRAALPARAWHLVALAALVIGAALSAALQRARGGAARALAHPVHVQEIAEAIAALDEAARAPAPGGVAMVRTSRSVQLSALPRAPGEGAARGYMISCAGGTMSDGMAAALAELLGTLLHAPAEVTKRRDGIYHVRLAARHTAED